MKGKPNSVRLEQDLEPAVQQWLEINRLEFAELVDLALRDFIFKKQMIELRPVDFDTAVTSAQKMLKRHKKAVNDLK
ncbi:MAG: hypothetical protein EBU49_05555 [Proteobacteria bacterium]|jgi:hypothetical protein|nr:hypothetical protein [Pseudomonadota bacterium]